MREIFRASYIYIYIYSVMSVSANKLYVVLFAAVVCACLIAVYVKYDRRNHIEKFEESADYKYRLEVMRIFDTHLQRNPTPDEIEKYIKLGNEQDILMEITKDYKLNTRPGRDLTDPIEHLTQVKDDEKDDVLPSTTTPRAHEDVSSYSSVEHHNASVRVPTQAVSSSSSVQGKKRAETTEAFDAKEETICISKASYDKLKSMLFSLQAEVMVMNKHI